jgi:hypothetical protein
MKCPTCNAWSRVVTTRMPRRVRECGNLHRFTTEEVLVHTHDDKRKEQEDRQREVAMAEGTIQDVANHYNVDTKSVRAWRKKYRITE